MCRYLNSSWRRGLACATTHVTRDGAVGHRHPVLLIQPVLVKFHSCNPTPLLGMMEYRATCLLGGCSCRGAHAVQTLGISGDPQGPVAPTKEALNMSCSAHLLQVCCLNMRWCRY